MLLPLSLSRSVSQKHPFSSYGSAIDTPTPRLSQGDTAQTVLERNQPNPPVEGTVEERPETVEALVSRSLTRAFSSGGGI